MTTVVSILLSDVVPLRERGTWQGYLNIVFATGAAAGAPLGGILADSIGWRVSKFSISLPNPCRLRSSTLEKCSERHVL